MSLVAKRWDKVPSELKKWFDYRDSAGVCWNGEAVLTLTLPRMEGLKQEMKEKYDINVLIDADTIYFILERIYQLEKRVKELESER